MRVEGSGLGLKTITSILATTVLDCLTTVKTELEARTPQAVLFQILLMTSLSIRSLCLLPAQLVQSEEI